jgi:hypothetical protein
MVSFRRILFFRPRAFVFCLWGAVLWACGAAQENEGRTVLSTHETAPAAAGANQAPEQPLPADLKSQIIKDGRTAAKLLMRLSCEDASDRGVLATVYAFRAGLKPEASCAQKALIRGTRSAPLLVRALSWRRLVSEKQIPPPALFDADRTKKSALLKEDPAVRILAGLSYLVRDLPLPEVLSTALSFSSEARSDIDKRAHVDRRAEHLAVMARPFDDGLLAAAVVFAEAMYEETVERDGKKSVPTAARLRQNLFDALALDDARTAAVVRKFSADRIRPGALAEMLENRLATRPEEMLCRIALSAAPALRVEALRALAVRGGPPTTDALAAAAAALRSEDADVQLEGARTFLLLVR